MAETAGDQLWQRLSEFSYGRDVLLEITYGRDRRRSVMAETVRDHLWQRLSEFSYGRDVLLEITYGRDRRRSVMAETVGDQLWQRPPNISYDRDVLPEISYDRDRRRSVMAEDAGYQLWQRRTAGDQLWQRRTAGDQLWQRRTVGDISPMNHTARRLYGAGRRSWAHGLRSWWPLRTWTLWPGRRNVYKAQLNDSAGFWGAGIAQWLEHRTRDWKVAGSNPCWNGGRIFFSRVDFLCWLLFRYPFHPRVTTVARKKSRSFCQKCRWQVTAKHAYTLRMWLLLNRALALVTTCP